MNQRSRAELLALIVLTGFVVATGIAYIEGYYRGLPYQFSTFLFPPGDKFVLDAPSVGGHFFGDFYAVWRHTQAPSPYLEPEIFFRSNYLPFTHVLFKPFAWMPYPPAVATFLIGALAATLAIFWRQLSAFPELALRALLTLILGALTYPLLFDLDRGNIDIVVFIALWLMLVCMLRDNWNLAAVMLAVAASLKGSPALLILLFVPARQWRAALLAAGLSTALTLLGLAIAEGGIIDNFNGLRDALAGFAEGTTQGTQGLQHNTTITGLLEVVAHWSSTFDGPRDRAGAISVVFLLVTIGASLLLSLRLWERVTLLVIAAVLVPSTSYDYRLVLMLLPTALVLNERTARDVPAYIVVLLGLLLIPKGWPVLWADVGAGALVNPLLMLTLAGAIIARGVRRRSGEVQPLPRGQLAT